MNSTNWHIELFKKIFRGRTDIYALGVVLYQMATGAVPYQGKSSLDVAASILRDRPTESDAAYDAYLRAMYRIRRETGEGMREAMDLLMDAVEDDPTSAMAWAGLAYGYGELGHSAFPEEGAYVRSKAAADRAIDLDTNLAEAHLAVGMYQLYYEWDFAAAEATFQRAVEINPSLVEAHYHLAWLYELVGRDEEAIRAGELTKEIDPLSPFYSGWLAEQYRDAGMYDTAIEEAEATLQLRPDFPVAYYSLGQTYKDLGNFEKAIANHEKLQDNYYWAYALAATLGAAGRIEEALEIFRQPTGLTAVLRKMNQYGVLAAYLRHLPDALRQAKRYRVLPGVPKLLARLASLWLGRWRLALVLFDDRLDHRSGVLGRLT